jgi:SulP family sulfate permease
LKTADLAGDFWGGLAAMLVALPASLAFGVAIYAPLGPERAAQGALAGLLGCVVIGIVAPLLGGTERLISAPCAPAAAVMGALAAELVAGGNAPARIVLLMSLAALMAAGLQALYGVLGGGTLIKFVPYPVVTGYLSGVGVVILLKQLPSAFGLPGDVKLAAGLASPETWQWPAMAVAAATIVAMALAPRLTRAVPSAIIGLAAGVAVYFGLGLWQPRLLVLEGNSLVVGPLGGVAGAGLAAASERFGAVSSLAARDFGLILMPALTLSVLLSIDTLKTCVLVDALTRTRHRSNREIVGQGIANLGSALVGGMPGAGTSGATLVAIASGARTRRSGVIMGSLALLTALVLGPLVAWTPVGALAGILIVVGFRMLDWGSVRLLRQRSTLLDFAVIASVVAVAVGVGLIAASGVGTGLAILLFLREQVRGTVIHRRVTGAHMRSRQKRLPEELAALDRRGDEIVVVELEGNLFFGTTDQLLTQLEPDLASRRFLVLDMRRVRSLDLTAAHLLEQIEERLRERGAALLFSNVQKALPTGQDLRAYMSEVGLVKPASHARVFDQVSDALEWAEDRLLEEEGLARHEEETPLELGEIDFLRGRKPETLRTLAAICEERHLAAGDRVFRAGDAGDHLYLVRRGRVRVLIPRGSAGEFHVATFGRGDFFGEIAFLDRGVRTADAVAEGPTELWALSRARFDAVAEEHPRLGRDFQAGLARALAFRMRRADAEIRVLEDA